jgi:outer membrane receptor protein involved in Fe transport
MRRLVSKFAVCCLFFAAPLVAAEIRGSVLDPSGAAVAGARVAVLGPVGIVGSTVSLGDGTFRVDVPAAPAGARIVVTAPGFATATVPLDRAVEIRLDLAAQVDSVRVVGSAFDVEASRQGGSVTVIPREEITARNQPMAIDLMRYVPGLAFSQTGPTGGLAALSIRGGQPNFNLVEIDGVPVNAFGGNFDFAQVPTAEVERIEVIRGSQSALYGPYANSGVVRIVTREPQASPSLDVLAEGGSERERRFALSGGGTVAGFGVAASASRMDLDGPVANSDYRNENVLLNVTRRFRNQSLALHGDFDSNENGVPGPYGSDPAHSFTGIDTLSRNKNNFSGYSARWEAGLSSHVREEVTTSFFLNNNAFTGPYGFSLNKDLRGSAEARTIVSAGRHWSAAVGAVESLEQVKNSYITAADMSLFPVRRNDTAGYVENRFEFGGRLFVNAGVRVEALRTGAMPPDGYMRPSFAARTITAANPKLAAAYVVGATRLHGSFGTGIRPPGGFDLAYTDNPALKPERTRTFDVGLEQRLIHDKVSLEATYFYNRFYDLIVILGGSLANLSRYQSDNLANSRAQGAEFSARVRPSRWVYASASYTRTNTEILALDRSAGFAQKPFSVGQELVRRPRDSASFVAGYARGRLAADVSGYLRGSMLDVEPSYGATAGLFRNPGFTNLGVNVNLALGHGVTAFGRLRNALDQRYEEVLGYPSPRLNFAAGLKWSLGRREARP